MSGFGATSRVRSITRRGDHEVMIHLSGGRTMIVDRATALDPIALDRAIVRSLGGDGLEIPADVIRRGWRGYVEEMIESPARQAPGEKPAKGVRVALRITLGRLLARISRGLLKPG